MNDYKKAGVDVERGYEAVTLMQKSIEQTKRPEVLSDLGGFGGAFSLQGAKLMEDPVLISGTDGVGTKLKLAFLMNKHDTVGIDLVAMSVNDILCAGAEPLYFLDYYASSKTDPEKVATVVKGISQGCIEAGAALIGGETAEMVGMYQGDEYDLVGFAVGLVDRKNMIDIEKIEAGDIFIGLGSSGLHSNGFSLVRHILEPTKENLAIDIDIFKKTLGEELLTPTKIYVKPVLKLLESVEVKGISHITGGGFYENIPRMLPEGLGAKIKKDSWPILPIFKYLKDKGNLTDESMFHTFNMGIGMILVVHKKDVKKTMEILEKEGELPYVIGHVIEKNHEEVEM